MKRDDDVDRSERTVWRVTAADADRYAGCKLTNGELDLFGVAIGNSSVPDSLCTIAGAILEGRREPHESVVAALLERRVDAWVEGGGPVGPWVAVVTDGLQTLWGPDDEGWYASAYDDAGPVEAPVVTDHLAAPIVSADAVDPAMRLAEAIERCCIEAVQAWQEIVSHAE